MLNPYLTAGACFGMPQLCRTIRADKKLKNALCSHGYGQVPEVTSADPTDTIDGAHQF